MKNKTLISFAIIMIIISSFQYSMARIQTVNTKNYYKDNQRGINAYKQINALKIRLADGSLLVDAGITTDTNMDIENNMKNVEIVFVIDTSGSMSGTRMNTTRDSTKTLIQALFEKIGDNHLKVGILYFNNGIDLERILNLTNNQSEILAHLDKIYASGGTMISPALKKAKEMLSANTTNEEEIKKIVCTLSDGMLSDEVNAIKELKEMSSIGVSTMSIFVETQITKAFSDLAIEKQLLHQNFYTSTKELAKTIVNDIYKTIYTQIISISEPKVTYQMNDVVALIGNDKFVAQVDEEILHGATIEIEYVLGFLIAFDYNNLNIKDYFSSNLIFNPNQKLLTEDKTNADYGWKFENGVLSNDSGNIVRKSIDEHKIKLVLSTMITPGRLSNLGQLRNYMQFSVNQLEKMDGNYKVIETIHANKSNTDTEENIRSMDVMIIPPTGLTTLQKLILVLNIYIFTISIGLIIICIDDYMKSNKDYRKSE